MDGQTRRWSGAWAAMMVLSMAVALYALLMAVKPVKPPLLLSTPYPGAMLAHFVGGGLALALGPWQFLTARAPSRASLHRWSGRLYGLAILVGSSAALVIAPSSQGGPVAHVGFFVLALFSLGSTAWGVVAARRGAMREHRRWMVRSFALTFAAVTLRFQIPLSHLMGLPFEIAYPVIAWASWIPNLLFAEWLLGRPDSRALPAHSVERSRTARV